MTNYNPLRQYLKDIGRYQLLTGPQEIALARRMRDENATPEERAAARELLINSNLRLVVSIAKSYHNDHMTLLDLIGEGNTGLITAVEKYNPELGYRFSTCATPWIKQAITKSIIDNGRNIRIPAHIFQLQAKYRAAVAELEQAGMHVDDEMVAQKLRIDVEKVALLRENMLDTLSMDRPLGEDADADEVADLIADNNLETPSQYTERLEQAAEIQRALDKLDDRTRQIIKMRYGLGNSQDPVEWQHEHTLEAIGNEIGLTRERVRQIEKQALQTLRGIIVM